MASILFILPSNKSAEYIGKYLLSEKSVRNIVPLLEAHACHLSFVSQRASEVEFAALVGGVPFASTPYFFTEEQRPPMMHRLRQYAANAMRDADFFFFVDDNIEFGDNSAEKIIDAVRYMNENPGCGIVQFHHFLGGASFGDRIVPVKTVYTSTERGLLIRNINGGNLFDEEQLAMAGTFEDASVGINAWLAGYYVAKSFNNKTLHHDKMRVGYGLRRYEDDNELHELTHSDENFFRWFESRFGPFKRGKNNRGEVTFTKQWNKVIEREYLAAGGIKFWEEQ